MVADSSPVENVKASVPGTSQAEEARIANSMPQTATVNRSTAMQPLPSFDGDPKPTPVEGTSLSYVINSSVPIIEVDAKSFYAVQNGIWFVGSSVRGPWAVATSVPTVIYVGYTPGYSGTVVAPGGVVVYGTGYPYTPWIGTVWYGPPVTYGFGVSIAEPGSTAKPVLAQLAAPARRASIAQAASAAREGGDGNYDEEMLAVTGPAVERVN